ncbi:hypothetical protein GCM10027061_27840 [Nesterenkonia suensis]
MLRTPGVALAEAPADAPDADARRFYRRQGFQEIDPKTGDHALLMQHQRGTPDADHAAMPSETTGPTSGESMGRRKAPHRRRDARSGGRRRRRGGSRGAARRGGS